jgi:hypothetical protein
MGFEYLDDWNQNGEAHYNGVYIFQQQSLLFCILVWFILILQVQIYCCKVITMHSHILFVFTYLLNIHHAEKCVHQKS